MKKFLFPLVALLLLAACNSNEKQVNDEIIFNALNVEDYSISYDNKYGFVGDRGLGFIGIACGQKMNEYTYTYKESDIIWKKQYPEFEDEKVDIGYGEIRYFPYNLKLGQFIRETYNIVVIYEASTPESKFKQLLFYDEKGNLLNKSKIQSKDFRLVDCPWDEDKMVIGGNQCILHVFDKGGNEKIFSYSDKEHFQPLSMQWKNIDNKDYFVYSVENIFLISLNNDEIIDKNSIDLNMYVGKLYPNEENIPKITNIELDVLSNTTVISLEITFYSGDKHMAQLLLDNQTGEIVE